MILKKQHLSTENYNKADDLLGRFIYTEFDDGTLTKIILTIKNN